jgi:hypothetical protein
MSVVSGAGTAAASSARFLRAVGGSFKSAGGNSGMNASSSGSMSVILTVIVSGIIRHPSRILPRSRTDRRAYPAVMEALVARLSHLDSQAEGAIRVVMFYDTLMRRRVDLPALARASANLAECVAGIRLHGTGQAN